MSDPNHPEAATAQCAPPAPWIVAAPTPAPVEETLDVVGPYTIVRSLGAGGFGEVFEAEQREPVRRRVALKIIKLGMDTRELIARFDAERQALALMEHPHIARVLDAGATPAGRPYFAMELVCGEPISSYCDANRLSIDERLALFDQVCSAVQHAHTKGVIHRDLKPSNVLVSTHEGAPLAKVIDFGIAKAISGRLTDKTLLTQQHAMIGTPAYMSPEQAQGSADIDTRSDIYALGVMLYELLTETTPFASDTLRGAGYDEIQRIICEVEPPRPSARLSQSGDTLEAVADRRRTEPTRLSKLVRGELDWIVMKALEKERARRYESAHALALDLRRYRAGEPVQAAPPSAAYRLRKFVRRHQGAVAAAAAIALALLVGVAGFASQARVAQRRADDLEQVARFQADMLKQVDPTRAGKALGDDVAQRYAAALAGDGVSDAQRSRATEAFAAQWARVNATDTARALLEREILAPAAQAIDRQFKDQPAVDATLRQALADRYVGMGLYEQALPLQRRALEIRRAALGADHPDTLLSLSRHGVLLKFAGRLDQAEPFEREALERRRRVLGEDHPETLSSLSDLGVLFQAQGNLAAAEPYYREFLARSRRVNGEDHPETISAINNMGTLLQNEGKLDAAEPFIREALDKHRRVLGEEHPSTLISLSNLGWQLKAQGKLPEAEKHYLEAMEKSQRVLGADHPDAVFTVVDLGNLYAAEGKLAEAEPLLREAHAKFVRAFGQSNPDALITAIDLGHVLAEGGKNAQATALLAPIEATARRTLTGDNARHVRRLEQDLKRARVAAAPL